MKLGTQSILLLSAALQSFAFNNNANNNLAVYWGQNSYGATHGNDQANWQKSLGTYCQDNTIDAIPLAFLNVFFSQGGVPEINFSNACSANSGTFPGTSLANCQFMAADIQACQAKGKIITLSLGGATGAAGFTSDSQATAFADQIWNLFLGGSSSTRPFGNAVLDGIDLDIEGGGSTGFAAFVNQLRSHMNSASKKYYITAAPQCPYPDAWLGPVLNAVGFDAVYVQFYNNFCSVGNFPNNWNFDQWDTWAKTVSPNKNVKIYIGAPASSTGGGGYADIGLMTNIIQQTRSKYSSFGGVMLWDASQAYANGRYDVAIKNALGGNTGTTPPTTTPPTTTPPTTTPPTTTPPTTTPPTSGSCAGVAQWSASTTYTGGQSAVYNGHLWTAQWWTFNDIPGGPAGVWVDKGACTRLTGNGQSVKAQATAPPAAVASAKAQAAASASVPKASGSKTAPVAAEKPQPQNRSSRFFRF